MTALSIALAAVLALSQTAAPPSPTMKVAAAVRGRELKSPFGTVTPKDPNKDVMLLIRIHGLAHQVFDAIPTAKIALKAGEHSFPLTHRLTSKDWVEIGAGVPGDITSFQLVLGELPPLAITPSATIQGRIESPMPDESSK